MARPDSSALARKPTMAEGRSNAGIAHQLWVTEGTVEKHVRSIMAKLELPGPGGRPALYWVRVSTPVTLRTPAPTEASLTILNSPRTSLVLRTCGPPQISRETTPPPESAIV